MTLAGAAPPHGPQGHRYAMVGCTAIRAAALVGLTATLACGVSSNDDNPFDSGSGVTASGTDSASSASGNSNSSNSASDSAGPTDGGTDGATSSESEGTGYKFDLPSDPTAADDGGLPGDGCEKVDFLFIIDNSISMGDEQQNLAGSFPSFIQTIQTQVVDDYHVMVIDTDGEDKWDEELVECHTSDCIGEDPGEACGILPPENTWTCGNLPTEDACDPTLGAGIDHDDSDARNSCGITDGKRWFDDAQPDPAGTFECIAHLYDGNSPELTMDSMLAATSADLNGPGGCNEGFLRDDAVLVVTFISDEEDFMDSAGDPDTWYQDLLARKNGNETAVVVLGLLGDTSLPDAVCPPDSVPGSNGGEYSPNLIAFVEKFGNRGLWGSVCAPDYGPFFEEAVGLIEYACDEYTPEG